METEKHSVSLFADGASTCMSPTVDVDWYLLHTFCSTRGSNGQQMATGSGYSKLNEDDENPVPFGLGFIGLS
ncbi:hypothetical protein OUZ56_027947 [Daphnia magna]|uniref:Uncharacterized protein n=1 Tax=Daphnia magna TaxID=35525 RepID=A0ABR0B318_9CRUS|nr:hypothetical protein OUZ56_027947 [Daphnia magna]